MRPRLAALAAPQDGVFTRSQALSAGYTEREIKALTRPGGDWLVVRTGRYCERSAIEGLASRERWLLKDRAAALVCRRPSVLSHDSAARVLEIDTLEPDKAGSHLTLHGKHGARTNSGVTRHRDLMPLCVETVDGLTVTSYARTAIDLGRWHGFRHGLVAVDSVRNKGVPLADLEAELQRMEHHPHIARARAAVRDSSEGAESVLETLGRELVRSLGIGPIETQFAVLLTDGRVVFGDILVGCHIFECHGFVKLLPTEDGGVATESPARVLWKQRVREREICAQGFGVSHIVWDDNFGVARKAALARLRKEYAVTCARFGEALPEHLRRFADEHPRRRPTKLWTPDRDWAA